MICVRPYVLVARALINLAFLTARRASGSELRLRKRARFFASQI